jgi:8-oxo-dGTP diphosphatase
VVRHQRTVDEGRVLLVHPTYKDTWDVPGGYVERCESPAVACRREIAEELRLNRLPRRLLSVDWAASEGEGDKLLFLFDWGSLGDDEHRIRLDGRSWTWQWVRLNGLDDFVLNQISRRLRSTIDGRATYGCAADQWSGVRKRQRKNWPGSAANSCRCLPSTTIETTLDEHGRGQHRRSSGGGRWTPRGSPTLSTRLRCSGISRWSGRTAPTRGRQRAG